jgi:hypothetical protein
MVSTTTYPKFSSRSHVDFEIQQKWLKLIFNFSCKNYNSKVGSGFAKVVGLLTGKPTKLVLHFTIFLWFYMNFRNHWTYGQKKQESISISDPRTFGHFTELPLVCTKALAKTEILTIVPFRCRASLPAAIAGRTWQTNDWDRCVCSRRLDWWQRCGRRCLCRWLVVRQRWRSHSSEMQGRATPCAGVEAWWGAREKLWVGCGSRARAEGRVHRGSGNGGRRRYAGSRKEESEGPIRRTREGGVNGSW